MATRPGPLTEWPWQWMGGYKYLVLAPVAMHTAHRLATKGWGDFDPAYTFMLPTLLLRMIHNQIWISLSRYQTARRKHLIVDRSLDFEQVDRVLYLAWARAEKARFHSLHHTQFRTNYSLFMPFYDYIYNTMDSSSDELYERSLKGTEETPDIVHLTHMTSLKSMYHLRIGITSISSKPCNDSVWYMWMLWPVAWLSMAEQLNGSGELFAKKYPRLRVRLIDGSGLATAVVLNSIPFGTKQVFLCGSNSKVTRATAIALCQRGVQVILNQEKEYGMLKSRVPESRAIYLKFSNDETPQIWIGDSIDDAQGRAPKGTIFIPTSQFPLKKARKDCTYSSNPAMKIPETMQNVHTCENWLPRRVMSAWRIAGILHALEGWEMHECGDDMMTIEKTWSAVNV
uniref:Very-long-chain aldehyde decarbonylase CER1-like C-terminal domain-containing protein n=1 Tax=Oryza rufipogon TaxID=4529 RepID=A0A0E0PBH8_ORYRU